MMHKMLVKVSWKSFGCGTLPNTLLLVNYHYYTLYFVRYEPKTKNLTKVWQTDIQTDKGNTLCLVHFVVGHTNLKSYLKQICILWKISEKQIQSCNFVLKIHIEYHRVEHPCCLWGSLRRRRPHDQQSAEYQTHGQLWVKVQRNWSGKKTKILKYSLL